MPYIKQEKRDILDPDLNRLATFITNGGDLNYCFSMLCKHFIEQNGKSYKNYAICIGAIECAKHELYRTKVALYEDKKIIENGDI